MDDNQHGCPYCERPGHECICNAVDAFFDDCFELLYPLPELKAC